ncbi:hypothetical protein GKZ90_0009990 [Flavobacterium sp. MC2016-06]|jgi:hypothetical protein|uniref:LIC_10190 family membrane protein n=1 Tax=Flavobacterium sp. MC2016-06 TaxID=2676308 RepID=UPI0012BA6B1A|nr:hypothetical protein [Flavobacterium sp. MC2016-06]MBU3859752.1 hypothetical protein [Flavobacterium sp. MC2016-06]
MILILLSWIYIFFTTINLGFACDRILVLKNKNFVVTSILGLFSVTILASIWAVFGRINIEFHVFLLALNLLLLLKFNNLIIKIYKSFISEFKSLQKGLKAILILISFLIIAQCASIPFVIDNESYYIQTIKWINEYGFVKGLVNLHLFLGQVSGWHVTQSVFNFSFLYDNFNDLSGFCLLLGTIFSIQKLNDFFQNQNPNYLIVGLFPLFNVFLFQFISAPSPDIPVYVFSFILFFYFLENFKTITPEIFNLIVIFVVFLFYIKNTTLTFLLIPVILFVIHFKSLSKKLLKPFLIAVLVVTLFFIKNLIICGSPVFPSKLFSSFITEYTVPNSIQTFYYDQIKFYGYFLKRQQYDAMSAFDLFLKWLTMPKLNGLFNKIGILLILVLPFLIYKFQNKKSFWTLYFLMIFQLFLLFVTSPQYRFFMNFILFFGAFCLVCFVRNKKIINALLVLSLLPTMLALFFPLNLNRFSNHKFMMEISNFSSSNFISPYKNTKYDVAFTPIKLGNLTYNSPAVNNGFWISGNGDLPCVNKAQIEYFKKHFHIIPQMRTNNLKDGFYAKNISNE